MPEGSTPGPGYDYDQEFYSRWAFEQLDDPKRDSIGRWKAANLARLALRTVPDESWPSICEIGGAEGIVLDSLGHLLGAEKLVNYEPCRVFCEAGKRRFPQIEVIEAEYEPPSSGPGRLYDAIVMCDLIEHVADVEALLDSVRRSTRFALVNVPIEDCPANWPLRYWLQGKRKPVENTYGPQHHDGHLRGFTPRRALSLLSKYFDVLDHERATNLEFYGSPSHLKLLKTIGRRNAFRLYGGALFVVGRSRA